MKIEGSTFVVTGGASGLGEAVCRALAAHGANVLIGDLNEAAGNKLAAEIGADKALFAKMNVTDSESVQAAIDAAIAKFKGLHGAINCAGVAIPAKVVTSRGPASLDVFRKVVDINLSGTFNVVRLCANAMLKLKPVNEDGERGVFVMTASVAAFEGQEGQAAYSASKGGLVGMTLPIARDLARFGMRICTVAPGVFNTPMMGMMPDKLRQALISQVPFPKRLGHPEEFAEMCCTIVSNTMLNGETIRLDGAIRMTPSL